MKHLFLPSVLALSAALAACGGDETYPAPFIVRIQPQDVVQTAVDQIEIVLRPGELSQHFQVQADMDYEGGTVFTRVTAAGEFVITIEKAYVDAHAFPGGSTFALDVPIYLDDAEGATSVADPTATATILRRGERIAEATRFLAWPLQPGETAIIMVACRRAAPDFSLQCTNNDP